MALKTGAQAAAAAEQAQQQIEERAAGYVDRFWMKPGTQTEITFLDGVLEQGPQGPQLAPPPCRHEHQLQRNGHWRNYYSCMAETGNCPICLAGFKSAFVSYFSIIDHSQYTDRQQRRHFATKRLFACKAPTLTVLNVVATQAGGLAGRRFVVHRPDNQAANVGTIFTFKNAYGGLNEFSQALAAEGAQIQPQDLKPYDYHSVITEHTIEQLQQVAGAPAQGQPGQPPAQGQYPAQGGQYPAQGAAPAQGGGGPVYPQTTHPAQGAAPGPQPSVANYVDDEIPF